MVSRVPLRPLALSYCHSVFAPSTTGFIRRGVATLPDSSHIYIHEQPGRGHLLSFLPNEPPLPSLAIGVTSRIPPTPDSFSENHDIMLLIHDTIRQYAHQDPEVQAQAAMYASQAGSTLGSGGAFFPRQGHLGSASQKKRKIKSAEHGGGGGTGGTGAGGASAQGGMGGAGRGGYIHVSDQRNPPDFGRVAWPEDIFGSLELDGTGKFTDGTGRYQESNTYRMVTREGILSLSPFLRGKLVERLRRLDTQARQSG
ncbi:hypothetical protein K431DRAFT_305755 [Polychaeton citri CBS 116435]|uniref:Uncharacterized protein n=1 Tax=Polychaeton citri CBS 116435 TaxID=1314669 RepID=A0A9P4Q196_9PEZI|nr:hypothetical protein K431DRAFT_305755 [Polychaeton citri CBS 116435]